MRELAQQRCFNHAAREAAARCPECRQFFCRECITEHDDRVLCAACLRKLAGSPSAKRRAFGGLMQFVRCAVGIVIAWFFFYLIGEILVRLPDSFHEGALWK
ncbi:MAG: rhomboid family protein [Acidobacteria bacterium]|nr:MAG: rhomboid family protein [Acidobacteriota bacterium]